MEILWRREADVGVPVRGSERCPGLGVAIHAVDAQSDSEHEQ